jgi:hypothetical protein
LVVHRNARSQRRPTSVFESRLSRIALSSFASGHATISIRSFSSVSALSSKRSVALKRWHSSSVKPGDV